MATQRYEPHVVAAWRERYLSGESTGGIAAASGLAARVYPAQVAHELRALGVQIRTPAERRLATQRRIEATATPLEDPSGEWLPVPVEAFARAYQVSKDGRVRNAFTGHVLSPGYSKPHRYRLVGLGANGQRRTFRLHRLVALAFVPNDDPEARPHVNHKNLDKDDNRAENLEWVDEYENQAHARDIGRKSYAGHNPNRCLKFSVEQIAWVRSEAAKGRHYPELAREIGANPVFIRNVILGTRRAMG